MERWVENRRPGWEERSPGQPDATLARIRNHITPKLGDVALDRLRPVDVDNLDSDWRNDGMAVRSLNTNSGHPHPQRCVRLALAARSVE